MENESVITNEGVLTLSNEEIVDGDLFYYPSALVTKVFSADSIEYTNDGYNIIENFGHNLLFRSNSCKKIVKIDKQTQA